MVDESSCRLGGANLSPYFRKRGPRGPSPYDDDDENGGGA